MQSRLNLFYSTLKGTKFKWLDLAKFFVSLRLKSLREEAGLSQAELATAVGVGRQAIYRFETSPAVNPTLTTLQSLAAALSCTVSDLVGESQAQ